MSAINLTEAQTSMLIEEEGSFTEFSQTGMSLKESGLIDVSPIDDHRFKWSITDKGKAALVSKLTTSSAVSN